MTKRTRYGTIVTCCWLALCVGVGTSQDETSDALAPDNSLPNQSVAKPEEENPVQTPAGKKRNEDPLLEQNAAEDSNVPKKGRSKKPSAKMKESGSDVGNQTTVKNYSGEGYTISATEIADSDEAQKLNQELTEYEVNAEELANRIRLFSDEPGKNRIRKEIARQQLRETLTMALDVKFRLEDRQVKLIEERVSQLKSQIAVRKKSSEKIVERRVRDLLEGDASGWTPSEPKRKPLVTATEPNGIPKNVAENIRALKAHRPGFTTEDGPPELNQKLDAIVAAASKNAPDEFRGALDSAIVYVNDYEMHNYNRQRHPKADVLTALNAMKDGHSDLREIPFFKFVTATGEKRKGLPGLNYGTEASLDESVDEKGAAGASKAPRITKETDGQLDPINQGSEDRNSPSDFSRRLSAGMREMGLAELQWNAIISAVRKRNASLVELEKIYRRLQDATRVMALLRTEFNSSREDLQLRIQMAQGDVDTGTELWEIAKVQHEAARATSEKVIEQKNKLLQANLALQRLQIIFESDKKVGEIFDQTTFGPSFKMIPVLFAKTDINQGKTIDESNAEFKKRPDIYQQMKTINTTDQWEGMVLKTGVASGLPILKSNLYQTSATSPSGMVLVELPFDQKAIRHDSIRPGDFVTVSCSLTFPASAGRPETLSTFTVLKNVKVYRTKDDAPAPAITAMKVQRTSSTIILVVFPRQEKLLRLAQKLSKGQMRYSPVEVEDNSVENAHDFDEAEFIQYRNQLFVAAGVALISAEAPSTAKKNDNACLVSFGQVILNLNEPSQNQFLSMDISLQTDKQHEAEVTAALEAKRSILQIWLTNHLAKKTLADIRGKPAVQRLRDEIKNQFNLTLFGAVEGKETSALVQEILFDEFHVHVVKLELDDQ